MRLSLPALSAVVSVVVGGGSGCDLVFGARNPAGEGEGESSEGEGEGEGEAAEGEGEASEGEGEGEVAAPAAFAVDGGRLNGAAINSVGTVFLNISTSAGSPTAIIDVASGTPLTLPPGVVAGANWLVAIRDGTVLWVDHAISDDHEAFNQASINDAMFVDDNHLYVAVNSSSPGLFFATPSDKLEARLDANRNIVLAINPVTGALDWEPLHDFAAAPTDEIPLTLLPDGVVVAVQFVGDDPFAGQFETAEPGPTNHQGVAIAKLRANDGSVEWHRMIESGTTALIDGLNLAHPLLGGAPDSGVYVSLETRGSPDTVRAFGGEPCAAANTPVADDGTTSVVLRFDGNGDCVFAASTEEPAGGALDNFSTAWLVGVSEGAVLFNKSSGGNRRTVSTRYGVDDGASTGGTIEDVDEIGGALAVSDRIRAFVFGDAFDQNLAHANFADTELPMGDSDDFFVVDADSGLGAATVQHHVGATAGADIRGFGASTAGSVGLLRDAGPSFSIDGVVFTLPEGSADAEVALVLP